MSTPTLGTDPRTERLDDPRGSNSSADGRHRLEDSASARGETTIADRVVEAMAARIASEEPDIGGAARRVLGVAVAGEDSDQAPRVEAVVAGDVVSLRLRLSVTYPAPVQAVTERVRQRLTERIRELTGKTVAVVDISVVALHRPSRPGRTVR